MNALADLSGVVPPMFTPFREDDRIDDEGLAMEARFLRQSGVSGIVVGGSMGEGRGPFRSRACRGCSRGD